MTDATTLLHLVPRRPGAEPEQHPPAVPGDEGFVHLCTQAQAPSVRDRFYPGQDLVVLVLDTGELADALRWEDSYDHGIYPHLYRPIDDRDITARSLWSAGEPAPPV